MANDFSGDGNCVSLWRFEDGALPDDSIGANPWQEPVWIPSADLVDYQEGAASADFERTDNDYYYRTDANWSADFPLKSTYADPVRISVCLWFKPESLPSGGANDTIWGLWAKTESGKSSFRIALYRANAGADAVVRVTTGYNAGADTESTDHSTALQTGRWYHLGVTYNDTTGAVVLRLWDDTAESVVEVTGAHANAISLTTAQVYCGNMWDLAMQYFFYDGLLDEAVVFNDILSSAEIDQIRQGTYGGAVGNPWNYYAQTG